MVCTASVVMSIEKPQTSSLITFPNLEATDIHVVAKHLLEHIHVPIEDDKPVSVQGRLHKHSNFWVNDLEASSSVRSIILHDTLCSFACF